ncbi:hypothetical protein HYS85_00865 [Candidatus Saccharibacteria bacterium]|nr:hypothetical protein [Candidatus Saccharibacteria bacterium]
MPKAQRKTLYNKFTKSVRYSEAWLVIFIVIFATIGSYGWMRSFAAPEDSSFLIQSNVSAEEQALFSSLTGASVIILASGPIAALLFWWIWRRSAFEVWAKLVLTVIPVLMVMAFT